MDKRSAAAVGLVAGLFLGFLAGQALNPSAPERTLGTVSRGDCPKCPPATVIKAPVECAALEERNQALAEQLQLTERLLGGTAQDTQGTAPEWSDELPEHLTAAGFEARVRAAFESCKPPGELLGFECSEPPCFAIIRPEAGFHNAFVSSCAGWTEPFGSTVAQSSNTFQCEDGTKETMLLLGATGLAKYLDNPSPDDPRNFFKRLAVREQAVEAEWTCRGTGEP